MKKDYIVRSEYIGSRLDRWMRKSICDIPQSLIEKNIRKGNIKVNNRKEKSSYKLKNKDIISIFNFNFIPNKNKEKKIPYEPTKKDLSFSPFNFEIIKSSIIPPDSFNIKE